MIPCDKKTYLHNTEVCIFTQEAYHLYRQIYPTLLQTPNQLTYSHADDAFIHQHEHEQRQSGGYDWQRNLETVER